MCANCGCEEQGRDGFVGRELEDGSIVVDSTQLDYRDDSFNYYLNN